MKLLHKRLPLSDSGFRIAALCGSHMVFSTAGVKHTLPIKTRWRRWKTRYDVRYAPHSLRCRLPRIHQRFRATVKVFASVVKRILFLCASKGLRPVSSQLPDAKSSPRIASGKVLLRPARNGTCPANFRGKFLTIPYPLCSPQNYLSL